MSDDVRAAAERLRTKWTKPSMCSEYDGTPSPAWVEDLAIVAEAYLSEHPADGDVEIDEAWLRSIGFTDIDNMSGGLFVEEDCGLIVSRGYRGQWLVNGTELYKELKTRSDLRRLLAALGIEAKEGSK